MPGLIVVPVPILAAAVVPVPIVADKVVPETTVIRNCHTFRKYGSIM